MSKKPHNFVSDAMRVLRGGHVPLVSKDAAIDWLRQVSGEDFGDDVKQWEAWLRANNWAYQRVKVFPTTEPEISD